MRLLSVNDLIGNKSKGIVGIFPICRASLYSRIKDKTFPQPVKVGNRTCWKEEAILDYIAKL